ncbi:MAG TPA: cytochrome c peroxidase [Candidatus Dormibacteraeota bacterium]|nr:cytochrome c peroxidase [Candidatus Dormibacteraeota bacterium]
MRRIAAWLPLYLFLALIALLLGSRPGLVRHAFRAAVERARGGALAPDARRAARPDSGEVALGRFLFFDPILSANKERACASCHMPARGFSDGRAHALALDRSDLPRSSPGLTNVSDQLAFFWDGRAVSLEDQIDGPVHAKRELGGLKGREIEARLDSIAAYRTLFHEVYGDRSPRYADAKHAIAAFERTLRSSGSTADRWWQGKIPEESVPVEARRGFDLFAGKAQCSRCHFLPLTTSVVPGAFAAQEFTVIGVPADPQGRALDPDPGRYAVTRDAVDRHAFKAPSLRNIARSAPYMHNGVFQTLDQVVRFYNQGGGKGLGLDIPNQAPEVRPLHLTLAEERALVRFLESLSDDPATVEPPAHVPSGLPVGGRY